MGSRPRIVSLVTNLYIAGDANRLLAFARAVDKTRFEHTVLLLVRPTDDSIVDHGPMIERYEEHGIRIEHLDEEPRVKRKSGHGKLARSVSDIRAMVRILWRLKRYFREHSTDIVDTRIGYSILFGAVAGRLARVPVIVATEYGTEFWRPPWYYLLGQSAFAMIDAIISDSQARIDTYQSWLLRRHHCAVVIPNGIYTPTTRRTREEMRHEFGLPADPGVRVIGQISRLVPYKGHRVLIDAAARVLASEPDLRFLICGFSHETGYVESLRRQAEDLEIADRVHIVSYPGPVADVWAAIDVHAHASLYDSAPIAIHESMALGLPAVVTRVGGIPDLVEEDVTALVVPPDDPQAFADALVKLLQDPVLSNRMGVAAKARHEARYQVDVMARALEALFTKLLRAQRGAPVESRA